MSAVYIYSINVLETNFSMEENSMKPGKTAPLSLLKEQSDLGPYCSQNTSPDDQADNIYHEKQEKG